MAIVCEDIERTLKNGKIKKGLHMNDTLKKNIDILLEAIAKKWDTIVVVSGMEGSGKSSLCELLAGYADPTFRIGNNSHERVVFNQTQFFEQIDKAPIGGALIFDEFVTAGLSQEANTSNQMALIKKLTTIRKKRLFILLVIPSYFMLRKYFAIFRTKCLIDCYTPDGLDRGYFKFFSYKRKKNLYVRGYKEFNMGVEKSNFTGRFVDSKSLFVDEEIYEAKKDKTINDITTGKKTAKGTPRTQARMEQLRSTVYLAVQTMYKESRCPSAPFFLSKYPFFPFQRRQIAEILNKDPQKLLEGTQMSIEDWKEKEAQKEGG